MTQKDVCEEATSRRLPLSLSSLLLIFALLGASDILVFFSPNTAFAQTQQPAPVTLTVQSSDLSGTTFEGMWVELLKDGTTIQTGFTPFSATVNASTNYTVAVANFGDTTFDHWEDDSTDQARAFSISQNTTFTAFYRTTPANNPPVAADDSAATDQDIPVTIPVLANDSDPDGDPLSITSTSTPQNGVATINADNTVTYSPDQGFVGTDTFSYTISDGNVGTDTATVTVTVSAAQPSTVTLTVQSADLSGDPIEGMWTELYQNGTIIQTDFTPFSATVDPNVQYAIAVANFGDTTFDHWEDGSTNPSRTFTISADSTFTAFYQTSVTSQNNPPVAADDSADTNEDVPVTISVLANDSDPDGDPLSVNSTSNPTNGTSTINTNNTITYSPNQGFVGTDTFSYTISDGNVGTDTATVTVTVSAASQATVTLNVESAHMSGTTFEGMWVELLKDGTTIQTGFTPFSATINANTRHTVAVASFGDVMFDHWEDGSTNITRAFSIFQNSTLTAFYQTSPTANDDSATTDEDVPVTIPVLANDSDPDGDTISLVSFDAASQFNGTVTRDDNGTSQNQTDDRLAYTPPSNAFGTDSFTYTISDDNGGTDTATVTVSVAAVNDPPIASNDSITTTEDVSVTVSVLTNDTDADGDTVLLDSFDTTTNAGSTITRDDNETPQDHSDDTLLYVPAADFFGVDQFNYTASDGNGGFDNATVTVTVTAVEDPPVANNDSATTDEDVPVTIPVLTNDSDQDGDTVLLDSFDATSFHNGVITLDDNGTSQDHSDDSLVYTSPENAFGIDTFNYIVSDGNGGFDTGTVTVTVISVNDLPVATDNSAQTQMDTPATIEVLHDDSDVDSSSLFLTATTMPLRGTATINANDTITYSPNQGYVGSDSFEYVIFDGDGDWGAGTITITVNPVQGEPHSPASPTGLNATSTSSRVDLSWVAPSDDGGSPLTGYRIERTGDGGATWSVIKSDTASNSTTYSDTGLEQNTAYEYRVSAINGVGLGLPSNTAIITTNQTSDWTANTGIVVPLFCDPFDDDPSPCAGSPDFTWQPLVDAKQNHTHVPIFAVVNPDNGPGPNTAPNCASDPFGNNRTKRFNDGIQSLTNAGVFVLGYVPTGFGSTPLSDVKGNVTSWASCYPKIQGILLDEMPNFNNTGFENHYRDITSFIHDDIGLAYAFGNPGSDLPISYNGTVDHFTIHEGFESNSDPRSSKLTNSTLQGNGIPGNPPNWHTMFDKSNFSFVQFNKEAVTESEVQARSVYVGLMYFTNNTGCGGDPPEECGSQRNPWNTISPHIGDMASYLDSRSVLSTIQAFNKTTGSLMDSTDNFTIYQSGNLVRNGTAPFAYNSTSGWQFSFTAPTSPTIGFCHWSFPGGVSTDNSVLVSPTENMNYTAVFGLGC